MNKLSKTEIDTMKADFIALIVFILVFSTGVLTINIAKQVRNPGDERKDRIERQHNQERVEQQCKADGRAWRICNELHFD